MKFISNYQYREAIYWQDLTEDERKAFDHYRDADSDTTYVRYRGYAYDLGDLEGSSIKGWDSQSTDSFFSATLFKFDPEDCNWVIVGRCYC